MVGPCDLRVPAGAGKPARAALFVLLTVALVVTTQATADGQVTLSTNQSQLDNPHPGPGGGAGHASTLGASSGGSVAAAASTPLTSPQPSTLSRAARLALYDAVIRPALFDYG